MIETKIISQALTRLDAKPHTYGHTRLAIHEAL